MKGWHNIFTNPHARRNGALKHNIMWDTNLGCYYRESCGKIALMLMKMSRKMLRHSSYRCSWCGSNCGFQSSMSNKGLRCSNTICQSAPKV